MERFHNVLHGASIFLIALNLLTPQSSAEMNVLTDSNWTVVLEGEWFVEFYAPWCGACRSFEPIWQQFSEQSETLNIKVGKADITVESGLAARFLVSQLPTLYHISDNGNAFRKYTGKRRVDDLERFINDKEWGSIEPTVWYLKPNSIPMAVAGALAGIGEYFRVLVQTLTDTYKVPMWLIVVGLIVATVVVGVILGLILVGIVGIIFPPKKQTTPLVQSAKAGEQSQGDNEPSAADSKKDK